METPHPRLPDTDIVVIVRNPHRIGQLGKLLVVIGEEGAAVGDVETQFIGKDHSVREVTVSVHDTDHLDAVLRAIRQRTDAEILGVKDLVFDRHQGGKLHHQRTRELERLEDLRYIYTPGVARVCTAIQNDPALARQYTAIGNSVGIFTNGTRVLGLGNIGAVPSLPVMEGKAVIYDQFVGLSATPVLIDTEDPDEFIETVVRVAPTFGGIHLEDIRTPDCFYIENELIKLLNKPVMHDDQHGTATVLLAAVLSALRYTGRAGRKDLTCAQIGLGAAGLAIARILMDYGFDVIGVDPWEESRARLERHGGKTGELHDAMSKADIVIATTGVVGLIQPDMIHDGQIILPLSNPVPEIYPEDAIAAGAAFAADGRSVNNAVAFPGLFKAALQVQADAITSPMKIAAAEVISALAPEGELVPSPFHPLVHSQVVDAVAAAYEASRPN